MDVPWETAGLGELDFAEHLLTFTEDEPEKAQQLSAQIKREQSELQARWEDGSGGEAGPSSRSRAAAAAAAATVPVAGSSSGVALEAGVAGKRAFDAADGPNSPAAVSAKEESGGGGGDYASNKACREKARRFRLNDRFTELAKLVEEPGQGPKTDKASILIAAISAVTNLRREIGQLRQLNKYLEERVGHYEKERGGYMYQQVVAYAQGGGQGGHAVGGASPGMMMAAAPAPAAGMAAGMPSSTLQPAGLPQPIYLTAQPALPGQQQPGVAPPVGSAALLPDAGKQQPASMVMPSYSYLPPTSMDPAQDASIRPPVA